MQNYLKINQKKKMIGSKMSDYFKQITDKKKTAGVWHEGWVLIFTVLKQWKQSGFKINVTENVENH